MYKYLFLSPKCVKKVLYSRWDSNPVTDLAEYLVVLLNSPAVALQGGGEGHAQHHLPAPALKPARLPAIRGGSISRKMESAKISGLNPRYFIMLC